MPRRSITTDAWIDDRFLDLTALAKLVFIRVVTGPEIGAAGAMRMTASRARKLAADLPATPDEWSAAWHELVEASLVRTYGDEWQWIPSWMRHQVSGIGMIRAARRQIRDVPEALGRAIGRELDRLFPPKTDDSSTALLGQEPDTPPTQNPAKTRGKRQPDGSLKSGRRQPDGSLQGGDQDQDQDQETLPSGERVSDWDTAGPPDPTSAGAESGGPPTSYAPPPDTPAGQLVAELAGHRRNTNRQPHTEPHLPDDPTARRAHVEAQLAAGGTT